MALLVWFTMGIALWHFTVFLPDRFWQGIVGAFLGSVIGAIALRRDRRDRTGGASATPTSATALTRRSPASRSASRVVWRRSESAPSCQQLASTE